MRRILIYITISGLLFSCDPDPEKIAENTRVTKVGDRVLTEAEEKTKQQGELFLAEMQEKPGVIKMESGLLYEVLEEGTGEKPGAHSTVKVHYTGMFTSGEVFDSSVERGEPIEFRLDKVIKGWTEGLQLMKKGAKYKFYIPYQLAYTDKGFPGAIPPYSALVFEVELLDFK